MFGLRINPTPRPHWRYSFPPPFPPTFLSPLLLQAWRALSPHEGTGRSTWPTDGLAVVEDKGEGRGPALRRMKETVTGVTGVEGAG